MSNSYIPEDLLVHLLIRLPPKSLGRFNSVSKSWNLLISSSEFIRFHLQYHSTIQKKPIRLFCRDVGVHVDDESEIVYSGHVTHLAEYSFSGRDLENLELGCDIQRIYNSYESHAPGMRSMLVGSCNGLLCQILCHEILCHDFNFGGRSIYVEYEISLCNPVTKTSRVLPKSPLFVKDGRERRRRVAFYGFGYDDVHDTYKVFLGSGPHRYEYGSSQPDAKYEYEVYSLRTDTWIAVKSDPDFHDYLIHCQRSNLEGVLINYALHWIIRNPYGPKRNKKIHNILAFDLRADQLNILQSPEAVGEYGVLTLSVLNGCLLLTDVAGIINNSDPEATFDMWMMKDYGLKESWTRIRIHNLMWTNTPVALLEDNLHHHKRKLIYHDHEDLDSKGTTLLNYDIESHQVLEFRLPPSAVRFRNPKQLQFVGSLVPPHPPSYGDKKI